ncbi:sulfite exporter TauE/SafE family protein [Luteococcus sp. OSA5]|uniref:sulfite exporter TauE/SafE family protein n=1 Tax=Luteococcus sp. OSA5 TaxID=3401630 RepID=UPI003B43135D
MITLSSTGWLLMVLAALIVGLSKTALPGSTALAVGLAASALPAKESTGTLLVLLMVGDLMAIRAYRHDADWPTLRSMAPPVVAGLLVGAVYMRVADDLAMRRVIGVILLLMAALNVWQRASRRPMAPAGGWASVGYGGLAGFTTMTANAAGPVTSLYFLSRGFDVRRFLGTSAWFYLCVNITKLPLAIGAGVVNPQTLVIDLVLVPVVLLAAVLGRRLASRISRKVFDPLVLLFTVVAALNLLW